MTKKCISHIFILLNLFHHIIYFTAFIAGIAVRIVLVVISYIHIFDFKFDFYFSLNKLTIICPFSTCLSRSFFLMSVLAKFWMGAVYGIVWRFEKFKRITIYSEFPLWIFYLFPIIFMCFITFFRGSFNFIYRRNLLKFLIFIIYSIFIFWNVGHNAKWRWLTVSL